MLRLLKYLTKKEWALLLLALSLVVLQVAFDLSLPEYMEEITHLVESEESTMDEIKHAGQGMLLAALGSLCSAILTALLAAKAGALFAATLREALFARVEQFSGEELDRFTVPSLINRTTGDVLQVQLAFVLGIEVLVKAPLKAIWAIVKIARGDLHWTAITVVGVLFFALITVLLIALTLPKFRRMQQFSDALNRITRESVAGIHDIRAGGGEHLEEARFEAANVKLTDTHLYTAHTMSLLSPAMQLMNNLLTIGCYWIGVLLINAAVMEARLDLFSGTVAFLSYMMQILSAFLSLAVIAPQLPRALVSGKRVGEVLCAPILLHDGNMSEGTEPNGTLEFKAVSFRYAAGGRDIIKELSFSAKTGQTVAIIGANGCGKSTLTKLIGRLYDVSEGEILVDGVNVKNYRREVLFAKIGIVEQSAFLFRGTVRQNIAFGNGGAREIEEARLAEVLADCGADVLEKELSLGLDTEVVEGGENLSQGERMLVSLARALCSSPEILILDDAFVDLDRRTAAKIRSILRARHKDMTVLLTAQRVSTVRDADRIVVLDRGAVLDIGTHDELMARCNYYRALASAQGEEVAQ